MRITTWARGIVITVLFAFALGMWGWLPNQINAQTVELPQFKYDPFWPKPLPDGWVLGSVGSVCVDARDHVFAVTRGEPAPKERNLAVPAPPVIEFDADGNVVNSWGTPDSMAKTRHGCYIDKDGNFWTAGNNDGIVQKYTHDGSKMLLQIGTKGVMDSADGTSTGKGLNASHTLLFKPTQVAVDPSNGDVYVSDGYGNKRVVVFDREGHYLRQWGRQGTQAETDAGVGGVFLAPVHCVMIGNDGLVYVCDRLGDRVEVFDKMGNFKRNILIQSKTAHRTNSENAVGTAGATAMLRAAGRRYLPLITDRPDHQTPGDGRVGWLLHRASIHRSPVGLHPREWNGGDTMHRTMHLSGLAAAALVSHCATAQAQQSPNMTFFATSVGPGKGGDLGGIAGADAHCQKLAETAGAGNKIWRAYLSTNATAPGGGVNARDRIGNGPWQNFKGEVIATSVADLHSANNKLTRETALTGKANWSHATSPFG